MAQSSIKILCVDDEKNVLKSLVRIFMDEDYEVFTASSGDEGLEVLREEEGIQVVVSDYRMPGMNGVDFLKEVCADWPETVRIVLSGYADTAAVVGAINEGQIYKFIPKPWNDDELKATIHTAVDHYDLRVKNAQLLKELQLSNHRLQELNESLEKTISDRTFEILIQNQALRVAQATLHALPIPVFAVDEEGLIVYCNEKAGPNLTTDQGPLLSRGRKEALDPVLNGFIDRAQGIQDVAEKLCFGEQEFLAMGSWLNQYNLKGFVVALLPSCPLVGGNWCSLDGVAVSCGDSTDKNA